VPKAVCWKCRQENAKTNDSKVNKISKHHIKGHNKGDELISLCQKHHDLVEGICGNCQRQPNCFESLFKQCWRFEDALPPINFKPKQIVTIETDNFKLECPECDSNNIVRLSYWNKTILPLDAYWKCNDCYTVSYLSSDNWDAVDMPTVGADNLLHHGEILAGGV